VTLKIQKQMFSINKYKIPGSFMASIEF